MLPDWPELKDLCLKAQMRALHEHLRTVNPLFGMIRRKTQHEGRRFTYETEEGDICEMPYEHVSAKIEMAATEVPTSTVEDAVGRAQAAASDIAAQMGKMFFQRVDEATRAAGTAIDAGGGAFTFELYCQLLGTVQLDFDSQDQPIMPTLCASPQKLKEVSAVLAEALREEANQKRLESIIESKRVEWRADEASRKLVD